MASFNVRGDFLKDFGVVQQRQVRPENSRLTFARLLRNLVIDVGYLLVGGRDGALESKFLGFGILRFILDDDVCRLELIDGPDGNTRLSRHAGQRMAAGHRNPFVGLCDGLSSLLDVAKSTVNGLLQRL